jgi:pilus assembly protein CpaB
LILLIGVLLAVVAFVGIIVVFNNQSGGTTKPVDTANVVVAGRDVKLGDMITDNMVETHQIPLADKSPDQFSNAGDVIGQVARTDIAKGANLTQSMFAGTGIQAIAKDLPSGMRAMAVRVDAVTGVGTLILPGDRVDVIITLAITPVTITPAASGAPEQIVKQDALAGDSTKLIVQNAEVRAVIGGVVGTVAAAAAGATATQAPDVAAAQQIVILALSPQDAEALGYVQQTALTAGAALPFNNVTLVLRSPKDKDAPPEKTTGVVLSTMIKDYGVLPSGIFVEASPAAK